MVNLQVATASFHSLSDFIVVLHVKASQILSLLAVLYSNFTLLFICSLVINFADMREFSML